MSPFELIRCVGEWVGAYQVKCCYYARWVPQKASRADLGRVWGSMGASGGVSRRVGEELGESGRSWEEPGRVGRSLGEFGRGLGELGRSLGKPGRSLGELGRSWEELGRADLGESGGVWGSF